MSILKFPFKTKEVNEITIPNPIVKLPVNTTIGVKNFEFLVDSGANITSLPLRWIYLFDLKRDKITQVTGIEGKSIRAYQGTIQIYFNKKPYIIRCIFIDSDTLPLLGRRDIWEKFSILFDTEKKETVFFEHDDE